jgi:gas vesicle protein
MSKTGNIITGIVSGLAVGATLGVLFAPDKGSKTRKKIKKTAKESKDALVEKTNEITEQLNSAFSSKQNEFSKELDTMVQNLSYKADDVIDAMEKKLAKLKKENEQIKMN